MIYDKRMKGAGLISLAAITYVIPGVPSTIIVIIGIKMIRDFNKEKKEIVEEKRQ